MARSNWHKIAGGAVALSMMLGASTAVLSQEKPQYGGTLEVATVNRHLSVLTWDPADWNWKNNHDNGQFYEHLFAADLSKARRNGGKASFLCRRLDSVRRHSR